MKNNMEIINDILLSLMKLLFIFVAVFEELEILVRKILLLVGVVLKCRRVGLG